jgi:hypothetical protein
MKKITDANGGVNIELTLFCINMVILYPMLQNATHLTSIDSHLL